MLNGTPQELEYHSTRAAEELARSQQCADPAVAAAHLGLANLHSSRADLVTALQDVRAKGGSIPIVRTDKEG